MSILPENAGRNAIIGGAIVGGTAGYNTYRRTGDAQHAVTTGVAWGVIWVLFLSIAAPMFAWGTLFTLNIALGGIVNQWTLLLGPVSLSLSILGFVFMVKWDIALNRGEWDIVKQQPQIILPIQATYDPGVTPGKDGNWCWNNSLHPVD